MVSRVSFASRRPASSVSSSSRVSVGPSIGASFHGAQNHCRTSLDDDAPQTTGAAGCSTGPSNFSTRPYRISVRQRTIRGGKGRKIGSGGSGQEALVDLSGHGVALAGCVLEALPVDDGDPAPGELDETGLLENSGRHGHGRPPDA